MDTPLIIGIKQYFKKMMKQYDFNLDGIIDRAELATVLNFREVELLPESPLNWESLVHDKKLKIYNPLTNQWEIIHSFIYGYSNFDNNGGGAWSKYINIPIITIPSEYAQYKIVIDSVNVSVYNSQGDLKTQANIASDFWNNVKSDSSDIRVFDQAKEQLYFWIEEWDYSSKRAVIWVNLTAGSSELNIAYGNPSALRSSYENGEQVFEFFDDFEGDSIDTTKWGGNIASFSIADSVIRCSESAKWIYTKTFQINDGVVEAKVKIDTGTRGSLHVRSNQVDTYDYTNVNSYNVNYRYPNGDVRSRKWVNGSEIILNIQSYSHDTEWHIARLKLLGSQITFEYERIDGTNKYSYTVTDTALTNGYIGLSTDLIDSGTVYYDWVKVYKLTDPADFGTPQILEF